MRRQLTEKQVYTLRFIHDYIKNNGCAPTRKETGEAFGISSTAADMRIFYILEQDCLRKSETGQWGRNIALTEKGISVCESFNEE